MLEQAIDELMAFVKRRGGRLIFGTDRTVFTEGDSMFIGGKAELLRAMREDSERESRKGERECHRALLHEIVYLRGVGVVSDSRVLARCIDASELRLRDRGDTEDDS